MKKRFFPVMLLAAALSMASCSDKDIEVTAEGNGSGSGTELSGEYAYINAAITLPSSALGARATRSATDDGTGNNGDNTNSDATTDSEVGADYENEVRSMILVLADKNDNYLTHTVVSSIEQNAQGTAYNVTGGIKTTELQKAYASGGLLASDKTVRVYAFCNYTARLLNMFEDYEAKKAAAEAAGADDAAKGNYDASDWLNWRGEVEEAPSKADETPAIDNTIWAKRSFLMTNAQVASGTFPSSIEAWEPYADKKNAYPLLTGNTSIPVERAAARIDFKDGSNNDNTYALYTTVTPVKDTTPEEEEVVDQVDEDDQAENETTQNFFSVKLSRMSLVNMSKGFYYLRRVSDDGLGKSATGSNNWEICGREKRTNIATGTESAKYIYNYVVDTDAEAKKNGSITENNASTYFNFALFNTDKSYNKEGWYTDNISKVLNGSSDNWGTNSGYKVWRYVTENTIPAASVTRSSAGDDGATSVTAADDSKQTTVQSTGIVFKAAIVAGKDLKENQDYVSSKVKDALENAAKDKSQKGSITNWPTLYSFNNNLYAGIEELVAAAITDGQGGPLYNAVEELLSHWTLSSETDGNKKYTYNDTKATDKKKALSVLRCDSIFKGLEKDYTTDFVETTSGSEQTVKVTSEENFKNNAKAESITVYEATDDGDDFGKGYYCYYFYWNRHNDNDLSGKMGQMEFAIVRNNVYKLAVTKISQLGHPRETKHDPDPVDPNDPDEDPTNYIKVDVQVLPWVVRVNDIEF